MNQCEFERKVPKYERMKRHILSMIESGELKSGDKLPTEEELAARFAFSLTTTRKALTDLAREGVICRIKKKGTFVSSAAIPEPSVPATPRTVSFILPLSAQTDDTLMQHVRGAQGYFAQRGYSMLIEATNSRIELENQFIDQAIDNQLSGLIIFPVSPEQNRNMFLKLKQHNIPFVLIDRYPEHFPVNSVVCDNFDGTFQATEHLISLGHKNIQFVAAAASNQAEIVRHSGYVTAMQRHGLREDFPVLSFQEGEAVCRAVQNKETTAFVCGNDYCAVELLRLLSEHGFSVPEDVSLVGFDGQQITEFLLPPLTTVFQPCFEISQLAAKRLVDMIEKKQHTLEQTIVPIQLLVRGSTAPPKQE